VLDPELDRVSLVNQQQNFLKKILQELLNISDSVNTYRASHPLNRFYTFKRGERIASCLNKIYISRELMLIIKKTNHRAKIKVNYTYNLIVSLKPGVSIQKSQEIWRINNSAMKNTELMNNLREMINDIKQTLCSVRDAVLI
jgi:hypothetical protein